MLNSWLKAALLLALPCLAACQTAILQVRVVEGDSAVHAAGSRDPHPLVVEVTDETGRPIEHAAVSFHLPDDGPGGVFTNGLHTDVVMTGANGRASVRGLQWNRIPGRFQVRIVVSFEQVRAGTVSPQYIEGPAVSAASAPGRAAPTASHGHTKWLWIGALVAGGAAAGLLAGHSSGGSAPPAAAATVAAAPVIITTIGTPSITVGKP